MIMHIDQQQQHKLLKGIRRESSTKKTENYTHKVLIE